MTSKSTKYKALAFCMAGAMLLSTGCQNRDLERVLMDDTEKYQDAHANPFFWDDAKAIDGYDNLYTLTPLGFTGQRFTNIEKFGDYLLMVGESYDSGSTVGEEIINDIGDAAKDTMEGLDPDNDGDSQGLVSGSQSADSVSDYYEEESETGTEEDYLGDGDVGEDLSIHYSFTLYDPWMNETLQSLLSDQISCDYYCVAGDKLFLSDSTTNKLSVYDTSLTLVGTYKMGDFLSNASLELYGQADSDIYYCTNYDNQLVRVDLSGKSFQYDIVDTSYLCMDIEGLTSDGQGMLISAIDPDSFTYVTLALAFSDLEESYSYQNNGYFNGCAIENGFLSIYDSNQGTWQISDDSGTDYFYYGDYYGVGGLGEDSFFMEQVLPNEEDSYTIYQLTAYDTKGKAISSFQYDFGDYEDDDHLYLSYTYAYLEDCNCVFFVAYDLKAHPELFIWDLDSAGQAADDLTIYSSYEEMAENVDLAEDYTGYGDDVEYGSEVTALEDPDTYDWGDLTQVHQRAQALGEQYGIEIYIGPEVPELIDIYSTGDCSLLDADTINEGLDTLESILSIYPEDFLSQLTYANLKGMRIYLSSTLSANVDGMLSDPAGFVNTINNYNVMVLDLTYQWDWNYTINHELSHMIDRKLEFESYYVEDLLYSEDTWNTYNPSGFSYLQSYSDYEWNDMYQTYSSAFVDAYGTTFATEDRAEVFGTVVSNYVDPDGGWDMDRFASGTILQQKIQYYSQCIRDGFHTENWPDTLPWELYNN